MNLRRSAAIYSTKDVWFRLVVELFYVVYDQTLTPLPRCIILEIRLLTRTKDRALQPHTNAYQLTFSWGITSLQDLTRI